MNTIFIPVDGSKNSDLAVKHALNVYGAESDRNFHICNVQPRLFRHISKFLSKQSIDQWHAERASLALASASELLKTHNAQFSSSYVCGSAGDALWNEAMRLKCSRIVIGASKKNSLNRFLENSTTAKLLEISDIPVEVITGDASTPLKRWAVPALSAGAATAVVAIVTN
ncbi:universal stress protein [Polynucleobacter antarcticus]|nr:universal stress protein [Polynucleobacter antarcticus]